MLKKNLPEHDNELFVDDENGQLDKALLQDEAKLMDAADWIESTSKPFH